MNQRTLDFYLMGLKCIGLGVLFKAGYDTVSNRMAARKRDEERRAKRAARQLENWYGKGSHNAS